MSGPIVRTGASPEFWENWQKIFGPDDAPKGKKKSAAKKAAPASNAKAAVTKPKAAAAKATSKPAPKAIKPVSKPKKAAKKK